MLFFPGLDFFMSNSAGVSKNAKDAYPTGATGPCSQFLVESELLICFCYFGLHYFDYYYNLGSIDY